jgi:hypothetical protein
LKNYVYLILFILLASMLAVGCTGSNSEENVSQNPETSSQDQAGSPQPTAAAAYQDVEWNASVQKNYIILKTDFDEMANATNNYNYQTLSDSDTDAISKYGQNIMDDAQKATEENDKYTVSPKFQDTQNEWRTALQISNGAGHSWILCAKDIKNRMDSNNGTENSGNIVNALGYTGSANYNMKRVVTSLESM